jgi:hypothetical protein
MKTTLMLIATAIFASCAASGGGTVGIKRSTRETCIVSDNKLGSMGAPVTKTYGDQEVKFCCKPCVGKFEKNPGKYLAKLR